MSCSGHLLRILHIHSAHSYFEVTEIKTDNMYVLSVFVRISFNTMNEKRKKKKNEKFVFIIYVVSDLPLRSIVVSTGRQDGWWWWWWRGKKREQNKASVYMLYVQKATWNDSFSFHIVDWPKRECKNRTGYVSCCGRIVFLSFQGRR